MNMVLENEHFRVSYNPVAGAALGSSMGAFAQAVGGTLNGEIQPQEETALYDGSTWRILLGDFRDEYQKAWPDWNECLAVYESHKAQHRSKWSTDDE
jgi:hypothetical protein